VARDKDIDLALLTLQLLKGGNNKNGSLAHTALGLAEDITAQNGLRNALLLHFRRMLKTALGDGTQKLGLQKEVTEDSGLGTSVGALVLGNILGSGGLGLGLLGILEEIFVVLEERRTGVARHKRERKNRKCSGAQAGHQEALLQTMLA